MTTEAYRKIAERVRYSLAAATGLFVILFFAWIIAMAITGGE